ncbi:MAG: carboxymuconolactone decarboxylase family protein [Burkholderiales bacterium]
MSPRLNANLAAPDAMKAVVALDKYVHRSGLDPSLLELVKTRASQINGCAYCIHMHTRDARARGEREERLYMLSVWRESTLYSARERAALAWAESLTDISRSRAPDEVYHEVQRHFSQDELVKLTVAIGLINVWNRIAIGFRYVHPAAQRAVSN